MAGLTSCYDDVFDTYDDSVIYHLRDRGPAGGWIFYVNPNYREDGWRYLEAAPANLSAQYAWGQATATGGADGTAVGTGMQNTLDIIANDPTPNKAADLCAAYFVDNNGVRYDDWFLPSKDELYQMVWNLRGVKDPNLYNPDVSNASSNGGGVGGFGELMYFSSSELGLTTAWEINLTGRLGHFSGTSKNLQRYIRPVRAF